MNNRHLPFLWLSFLLLAILTALPRAKGAGFEAKLLEKENEVVAQRQGAGWQSATIGMGLLIRDRVRTGFRSRAVLALTDRTFGRMDERTFAEIGASSIKIFEGSLYAYSRERSPGMGIDTPSANGIFRGTQVVVRVTPAGKTLLSVLEGEVELFNALGRVTLRSGEQGEAEIGKAPRKTSVIAATNLLQWALYYPGVLDPGALGLSKAEEASVAASLAAYRVGDLLGALEKYPKNYRPNSAAARLYQAGVVLAVGRVDEARRELAGVRNDAPGRRALEEMIAAANFLKRDISKTPSTASEWLARSYYLQSRDDIPGRLEKALDAARRAAALAPDFGYASVRVAELEFSQGHIEPALKELARNPRSSARNAQAHALRGFLLSAQNRIDAARAEFQTAIDLDGALGNAWLGRGLCAIRQGRDASGRLDLQIAATVEPYRSILHSYMGKAFSEIGDNKSANKDLAWARELDPNDPTPLLYSAIQRKRENRYNEAIADLEKSVALNDNRRLYRSKFLLDQDLAIRNANLATIYRNNGMIEQSVREAVRAVNNDYSSAPAHLFLSNSYNTLRDPSRVHLRYETAWFNELLLSNLLSPVGGGSLSQFVSEQEYSKLFEKDGVGASSVFEYRSTGELREIGSIYGNSGNLSFALDALYHYHPGIRFNNKLSNFEGTASFKLQLGPHDSIYLHADFTDLSTGFVDQVYDQKLLFQPRVLITPGPPGFPPTTTVIPNRFAETFRQQETQDPGQALLGWHHEWGPGNHTLLLLGRLATRQEFTAGSAAIPIVTRPLSSLRPLTGTNLALDLHPSETFDLDYHSSFETYSAEAQQIFILENNTLLLGARYQRGEFDTRLRLTNYNDGRTPGDAARFPNPPADQDFSVEFERINLYLYDTWKLTPWLSITGGVTYDSLTYPDNYRSPPVNNRQADLSKVSPKAGLIAHPWKGATVRAAYAEAISGASFDESVRLEPTQVAGFLQAYRSLASESLIGSVAGGRLQIVGVSFEQMLPSRTYLGVGFENLEQRIDRTVGVFDQFESSESVIVGSAPSSLSERIRYREEIFTADLHQLIGENWSLGARYRYTNSDFESEVPALAEGLRAAFQTGAADSLAQGARTNKRSGLHELGLYAIYNHPCGFFGRAEANYYQQVNVDNVDHATVGPDRRVRVTTSNMGLRGDDFWQFNVMAGYRFFRNQCEISVGVLNLTDRDYQLSPVNPYDEFAHERTFVVRCKLSF